MECPWCGGGDTERIGAAGSLLMTEQWFCRACDSPFEVIRKRGRADEAVPGPAGNGVAGPPGDDEQA